MKRERIYIEDTPFKNHPLNMWIATQSATTGETPAAVKLSLCKEAGIQYITVYRILRCIHFPQKKILERICKLTGLSPSAFYDFYVQNRA